MKKYLNWCIITIMLGFFIVPYNCSGGGGCSCDPKIVEAWITEYGSVIKSVAAGPKCGNVIDYNKLSYIKIDFVVPINQLTFSIQNNTRVTFYNSQAHTTQEIPDFFTGVSYSNYTTYEGNSYPSTVTLNINKSRVTAGTKYTFTFISKSPNNVKTRTGVIIDTTFNYSFTVQIPDGRKPYITDFLPGLDLQRVSPRFLYSNLLSVNFSEPLSSFGVTVEDLTSGTVVKSIATDFIEGNQTVKINFGYTLSTSLGHTFQVKFLSEKTQCDLTTRDMSGEPLTVPPGQPGHGSAINDVRTFRVGKIWLEPGVGGNRVTVSPAYIRGMAAPDVTRVKLESTTGEKPVEVNVQPPSYPGGNGYFTARFFFKSPGTKTIYARNVSDPNDYDVITFDYYPERMTIDTLKFPCMFPGETSNDDKFDVNKVLAYMFNNNDASCINPQDEGGCGLCNELKFSHICKHLADEIDNGKNHQYDLFPLRINNILWNLGFFKYTYEKNKCDCIIPDIVARINGWTFYDFTDLCIPKIYERCCPQNLPKNPPPSIDLCEPLKEPRDIANELRTIGISSLDNLTDTNLGEKEIVKGDLNIKVGAELLDLRLNLRNSSLSFSPDNSSSTGHYTLRIDIEGGDTTIRGYADIIIYIPFTGVKLVDTHIAYTLVGYWNNFNLQFDIIPELVFDHNLGKNKVNFRIENNSELSQPILFLDKWIYGGLVLTPILNWIAAEYINSNSWARKTPEKLVNNLFKPLVFRKIKNYLNNLGVPVTYNTLDEVPIERLYFLSGGDYRCFDGSTANSTLMVEIPLIYANNP